MEGSNKAAPDDIENMRIPLLAASIGEDVVKSSSLSSDCCIFRAPERLRHLNEKMEGSNEAAPDVIENPPIPLLAIKIEEELGKLSRLSSKCCIFRVPERLRHLNTKAYEPRVVSIGPLHHGKKALRAMEEHKKRYLQHFLNRTGVGLEDFLQEIRSQEANIRSCYAETFKNIESDEFIKIILVDATFILELLLRWDLDDYEQEDQILNKPMMLYDIWLDMWLLENQLPFFILKGLLAMHFTIDSSTTLDDLSLKFFQIPFIVDKTQEHTLKRVPSSNAQVEHFVDFMRSLCLPESENTGELNKINIPSITVLSQAGVKFEMVPNNTHLFDLDIKFTDGVLKIPKITIQDQTEVIIRNLIAFEQCNCMKNHITDYIVMMDNFVNIPKDVDLLVQSEIIENALGDSKAVSNLINALGNGVGLSQSEFHYAPVCKELEGHCNSTLNKWNAYLRQNYINTPWAIVSVVAAVFVIILTFIQTVCSIISLI